MELLISVRSRGEAQSALAGGADVIDAKEPSAGALGAVSLATFGAIVEGVAGLRPITAAIGDADDEAAIEARGFAYARAGASFVKIGFAGIDRTDRAAAMLASAVKGATAARGAVVAVAYADCNDMACVTPEEIVLAAARVGARGVLLDTGTKNGGGLMTLMSESRLREWVLSVQRCGMFAALGGQLSATHLPIVEAYGADIAGIRGAACDGGRAGTISVEKVRALTAVLRDATHHRPPTRDLAAARS